MAFFDMNNFDGVVKLLGDVFESVAGAIYLDSGCSLDTCWGIYYPMMKRSIEREIKEPTKNPVAELYETYTGRDRIKFEKSDVKQGQDISLVSMKCFVEGFKKPFEGLGLTKHQAKIRAVKAALEVPPDERDKINQDYHKKHPGKIRPDQKSFPRRSAQRFSRHNVPSVRRRW